MTLFIYLIAFFEGFTTLSVEIVALRNFTPIIGTNSVSTSIILGVILLALSYGYYMGGKISSRLEKKEITLRIIQNLVAASAYYLFFTFIFDQALLIALLEVTGHYIVSLLVVSLFLFFIPVFLASQTIPLLSELLKGSHSGEKMGKLLFYSTIGSFLGSLLTSTVLFPLLGITKSAIINVCILTTIAGALIYVFHRKINALTIITGSIWLIAVVSMLAPSFQTKNTLFSQANAYHSIQVENIDENRRVFFQNGGYASGIYIDSGKSFFAYIKEMKTRIVAQEAKNILIIGAAGFTLPNELAEFAFVENIDVVDVDRSLKKISETYFLQKKLSDTINFYPEPSRFFINQAIEKKESYDVIVIDIYVGDSLPPQTLTYEFFQSLNSLSDTIYINIITDSSLQTDFSRSLFTTLRSVFGNIYYKNVNNARVGNTRTNFIVSNKKGSDYSEYMGAEPRVDIYYDDQNSIELDLFEMK